MADGVSAVLKQAILRLLLTKRGMQTITNAASVVAYCCQHLTTPKKFDHIWSSKRASTKQELYVHHLLEVSDLEKADAARTFADGWRDVRATHQVFITGLSTSLLTRPLGCVCDACMSSAFSDCLNQNFVAEPRVQPMTSLNTASTRMAQSIQQNILQIKYVRNGEYIAVRRDGKPYQLAYVVRSWHTLLAKDTDELGSSFNKGSTVARVYYLELAATASSAGRLFTKVEKMVFVRQAWVLCRRVRMLWKGARMLLLTDAEHNRILAHR